MFLTASDIQLGRGEPIKDTARVLGRMVHGAVFRTFAQRDVEEFARYAGIPTINALTDEEHPCQILADIFTIQEKRGPIAGKVVTFVGDGACNVPSSWMFAAANWALNCASRRPSSFSPPPRCVNRAGGQDHAHRRRAGRRRAARTCFTPTSGFRWARRKRNRPTRLKALAGYQINADVVKLAKPGALVMHCLPAYRGKEIDEATFEANARDDLRPGREPAACAEGDLNWLVS